MTVQVETIKLEADAYLYKKQKDAEAIKILYETESEGLEKIKKIFDGNNDALLKYLMLKDDQYTKLAEINSKAIKELNPKITIWNTSNENSNNDFTKTISNLIKCVPPLFGTIEDQTGIKLFPSLVETKKDSEEIDLNN
jgi:flotillin